MYTCNFIKLIKPGLTHILAVSFADPQLHCNLDHCFISLDVYLRRRFASNYDMYRRTLKTSTMKFYVLH